MGNVNKGLQLLQARPLIAWVLERIAPQVDEILINANRDVERYAEFGHRVITDRLDGFAGPLAGLECGLAEATHPLVVTVPCDSPFLPLDLVARLSSAVTQPAIDLAVARTGTQPHPVFCLCRRELRDHLNSYLNRGGRKIDAWYASLRVIEVPFDDQPDAFSNINTIEELRAFEAPC